MFYPKKTKWLDNETLKLVRRREKIMNELKDIEMKLKIGDSNVVTAGLHMILKRILSEKILQVISIKKVKRFTTNFML